MIPFSIPELALKALPLPQTRAAVGSLFATVLPEDDEMFVSVLDLMTSAEDGEKPGIQIETDAIAVPLFSDTETTGTATHPTLGPVADAAVSPKPSDIADTLVSSTFAGWDEPAEKDLPTPPVSAQMAAGISTRTAKKTWLELPAATLTKTQATLAQTVLEGRLPLAAQVVGPAYKTGNVTTVTQAGESTTTMNRDILPIAPTRSDAEILQKASPIVSSPTATPTSQGQIWHAGMPITAGRAPKEMAERPPREMTLPQASTRDSLLPGLTNPRAMVLPPAPSPAVAASPVMVAQRSVEADKPGGVIIAEDASLDLTSPSGTVERSLATSQPATATATAAPFSAGVETARHIANQIAVAVINQKGQTTEIALNPEELGRVRMTMTTVDLTITLNIMTERPETMDLMRRHIETLTQEFRALGYDNVAFSFGDGHDAASSGGQGESDSADTMVDADTTETTTTQERGTTSSALDMRL